ncbi:hypothetical protein I4U23_025916 [Adineta vaga]|nr:hypothetical protein I4U23_025916 [Adineta vaga]
MDIQQSYLNGNDQTTYAHGLRNPVILFYTSNEASERIDLVELTKTPDGLDMRFYTSNRFSTPS